MNELLPYTYGYQYSHGIRFNGGVEVNGERPSGTVPFYSQSQVDGLVDKLRESELANSFNEAQLARANQEVERLRTLVERAGPWSSIEQKEPEVGKKFICLWNDGSGCVMYWRHDCGFIDHDGDECAEIDWDKISFWAYLPDGFKFWCEVTSEDPMTLPLPSTEYASK